MRWQDHNEPWDEQEDEPWNKPWDAADEDDASEIDDPDDDEMDDDLDEDFDGEDDEAEVLPCPACGFSVYEDSPWCPSCGQYVTFPDGSAGAWSGRPNWWIVLGILGVGATLLMMLAV